LQKSIAKVICDNEDRAESVYAVLNMCRSDCPRRRGAFCESLLVALSVILESGFQVFIKLSSAL